LSRFKDGAAAAGPGVRWRREKDRLFVSEDMIRGRTKQLCGDCEKREKSRVNDAGRRGSDCEVS